MSSPSNPTRHRSGRAIVATGSESEAVSHLLNTNVLHAIATLHRRFEADRQWLLSVRSVRQARYDHGDLPRSLGRSESRHPEWRVEALPEDVRCRRVEITGPINDTKMVINMLSRTSDGAMADAAMLDFEDSMKPTWGNVIAGLQNLEGAVNGTLTHRAPATVDRPEKVYKLNPADMPLLMVRVRGLHLDEPNVRVNGEPVSAGLFDLTASAFRSVRQLLVQGKTPMFYIPKCESADEATWWNNLFRGVEQELGLRRGVIRVTFLIETLPAALDAEAILFEIRERAVALNVGRWDKIFSDIKVVMHHADRVLPDRSRISMDRPWMRFYALRLIAICHRRGALALGGMAAFTPGRDPQVRLRQEEKVRQDKSLESAMGHDGCWVSHPFFIQCALESFPLENQLDFIPADDIPDAALIPVGVGPHTLGGLRKNVRVGIAYMKGWAEGRGCVALDDLMEDLATLEISRAQTQQWLRHRITLADGQIVTVSLVKEVFAQELERFKLDLRENSFHSGSPDFYMESHKYQLAAKEARRLFTEAGFRPFLQSAPAPSSSDREAA